MASSEWGDWGPEDSAEARRLLIQLLEERGFYRISGRARDEGTPILKGRGFRSPLDGSFVVYVLSLLRRGYPRLRRMLRGNPPDSIPRGWCMRNCDGNGLFIEMTVERVRANQYEAFLISFHY